MAQRRRRVIVRGGCGGPEPASGTLIFLFTDVEGSTRLWERLPEAMKAALERHDRILQAAVAASGGRVVKTTGDGIMAVFSSAAATLATDRLPEGAGLRDLGAHRLKDLGRPERLFQLVHPDLADAFPPLATLDRRPNNLPTQTSTFVGRDTQLAEIGRRLGDEAMRLLTLTGPGGTGKTRLALRAAADQIDRFEDGVFFVDLSAVRTTEDVPATIARTVGLSEITGSRCWRSSRGGCANSTPCSCWTTSSR
jgi:hypothetical protein